VKVSLPALSATRQKKVRAYLADQKVRKVREDLLTALFRGFTLTGALPASLRKVPANVRDTFAEAQGVPFFEVPMDWSEPGRETVEGIRLFFGKYLLPVWPELAKVWPEVILVGLTDGVPALYAIEDEE
jgi:hypothetical protein